MSFLIKKLLLAFIWFYQRMISRETVRTALAQEGLEALAA